MRCYTSPRVGPEETNRPETVRQQKWWQRKLVNWKFLTIRQSKKNGQTILNNQLDKDWLAIANLKPTFTFLGRDFAK